MNARRATDDNDDDRNYNTQKLRPNGTSVQHKMKKLREKSEIEPRNGVVKEKLLRC